MTLEEGSGWITLLIGLLLTALGAIPILVAVGLIGFALPAFVSGIVAKIASFIIAAAGVYILIEAFFEDEPFLMMTVIAGLVAIGIGMIEILHMFNVISFGVPFFGEIFFSLIFVLEGILLIIAAIVTI